MPVDPYSAKEKKDRKLMVLAKTFLSLAVYGALYEFHGRLAR